MLRIDKLQELLDREEALHPDLVPWVTNVGRGHLLLNSPLVQEMFLQPTHCALVNARYAHKQQIITEAMHARNPHQYIWAHERPYRVVALTDYLTAAPEIDDRAYWELVSAVWIDSENIWQNKAQWRWLWSSIRPGREATMADDERVRLLTLPDEVEVFRGITTATKHDRRGFSWALDREKAAWFALRYHKKGSVLRGVVKKKAILALLLGRNEQEVISMKVKIVGEEEAEDSSTRESMI